jgi:hypothetical protein
MGFWEKKAQFIVNHVVDKMEISVCDRLTELFEQLIYLGCTKFINLK